MGKFRYTEERIQKLISENNLPIEIKSTPHFYKEGIGYFIGNKEILMNCYVHGEIPSITPFNLQKQAIYKYKNRVCPRCNEELETLGNEVTYNIVKSVIEDLPNRFIHKFSNIVSVELLTSESEFNQQKKASSSLWNNLTLKLKVKQQLDDKKYREKNITRKWKEIKKDKKLMPLRQKDTRMSLMAYIFEWVLTELKVNHQLEYSITNLIRNNFDIKNKLVSSGFHYPTMAYDFYLDDYDLLIEIDGSQHYETDGRMIRTNAELINLQQRDNLKAEVAKMATEKELIRLQNFFLAKSGRLKGLKHLVNFKSKRSDSVFYQTFLNINKVLNKIGMVNISFNRYIEIITTYNIGSILEAKSKSIINNRNSVLENTRSTLRVIKPAHNINKTESYVAQCQSEGCKSFQIISTAGIYSEPPVRCYACSDIAIIKQAIQTVENATCFSNTNDIISGFEVFNKKKILSPNKGFFNHGLTEDTAIKLSKSNVLKQTLIIIHPSFPKVFIEKTINSVKRDIDYHLVYKRLHKVNETLEKLTDESQKKLFDSQFEIFNVDNEFKAKQIITKERLRKAEERKKVSQNLRQRGESTIQTKTEERKRLEFQASVYSLAKSDANFRVKTTETDVMANLYLTEIEYTCIYCGTTYIEIGHYCYHS